MDATLSEEKSESEDASKEDSEAGESSTNAIESDKPE